MRSFKTKLKLNNSQKKLCEMHAGTARFAYNYGLEVCKQAYEAQELRPSAITLHKVFVRDIKSQNEWLYLIAKSTPQLAFMNLEKAFKNCFKHRTAALPKFHKKGGKDSFGLEGTIKVFEKSIQVPKLGKLRTFEKLPVSAKPKMCVISKRAGDWYISFIKDTETTFYTSDGPPVGVDLGIKNLATLSDGKVFANPRAYKKNLKKLKTVQRELSRRKKGGANRKKSQLKVAKVHLRIANIRKDQLHKLTTYLAKNHSLICIEDLNVSGMLKNHKLAQSLMDSSFGEFRRQLTYKTENLVVIDQFYPSTQLCSVCGYRQQMPLNQRVYNCPECNLEMDRDLNAAINILSYLGTAQPWKPIDGKDSSLQDRN